MCLAFQIQSQIVKIKLKIVSIGFRTKLIKQGIKIEILANLEFYHLQNLRFN